MTRKIQFQLFSFAVFGVVLLTSCDSKPEEKEGSGDTTTTSEVTKTDTRVINSDTGVPWNLPFKNPDSEVAKQFKDIKSELDFSWARYDSIQEGLAFSMKRLIDEIGYNEGVTEEEIEELKATAQLFEKYRYAPLTIPPFEAFEENDRATDEIAGKITSAALAKLDTAAVPLANELIKDIRFFLSEETISTRSLRYSSAVEDYNVFINENKEALEEQGVAGLQPLPSFLMIN